MKRLLCHTDFLFPYLYLLAILNFLGIGAFAQPDPPQLRCVEVESNGNVTLTWVAPSDTGTDFNSYQIYSSSSSSGPFVAADSVFSYSTISFTVTSVNANTSALYFFLKTRQGLGVYSVSSDTLRSIRMIVTSLSNEIVRLNWNRIHNPPLPTTVSSYNISKELTPGVFTPFLTTIDTTANDTNIVCNKFINYKVTQGDQSGCISVSSVDGELFRDTEGPAPPLLDTVSVAYTTGQTYVTWFADSSLDTQGYVIYLFNGTSYDSIGAVYGINNLSFLYTSSQADDQVETFSVAAFDSCRNLGSLAVNHNTIHLTSEFVKCGALVTLSWNAYNNLEDGVQRYEIWVSENSGPFIRDGFVPAGTLSYQKTLTTQGAQYDFYIRMVGNSGKTASSNMITIIADIFDPPDFLYIRSASVEGSSVKLSCFVDEIADIKSYRLYSADAAGGPFNLVKEKPYTPVAQIYFTDDFANADRKQKFYQITATDSCGVEFSQSNISGTVFLTAKSNADFVSDLTWLDYSGWQGPTDHFNIYRVKNGAKEIFPFVTVGGDTTSFSEIVSGLPQTDGNLCYVVEAVEEGVNSFGFTDSALSNIACAPQPSTAFIPNAFTPGGKNPVFIPYTLYADPASYDFRVFNRWGQQVFESSRPGEGWDGTYNNDPAPAGIYVYRLVFRGYNKKDINRTGTVTLLR